MATFIILGKFDREGLATLLPTPDTDAETAPPQGGRDLVERLAESVDAKLLDVWFTTGRYDVVIRISADSGVNALAFAVSFGRVAGASTETLGAESSVDDVLDLAREAHTRHHTRHEGHG
jgi:uncharacterized protein with GYD domain